MGCLKVICVSKIKKFQKIPRGRRHASESRSGPASHVDLGGVGPRVLAYRHFSDDRYGSTRSQPVCFSSVGPSYFVCDPERLFVTHLRWVYRGSGVYSESRAEAHPGRSGTCCCAPWFRRVVLCDRTFPRGPVCVVDSVCCGFKLFCSWGVLPPRCGRSVVDLGLSFRALGCAKQLC